MNCTFPLTSKFEWKLNHIRMENIISAPIWASNFFLEVLALLDVRHRSKLQPCAISRKSNEPQLINDKKPYLELDFGVFGPDLGPQRLLADFISTCS